MNLDPLLHALGLDANHASPWRNFYITDEPAEVAVLVANDLMEETRAPSFIPAGSLMFMATPAGKIAAMKERERRYPPPSKYRARYLHYLDIADCCDVTFGEYLRRRMYAQGSGPG